VHEKTCHVGSVLRKHTVGRMPVLAHGVRAGPGYRRSRTRCNFLVELWDHTVQFCHITQLALGACVVQNAHICEVLHADSSWTLLRFCTHQ
jgi:hypothetical protein